MRNTIDTYLVLFVLVSCARETAIPVQADFTTEVENNDYSVPVRIQITNTSNEADSYSWTFEGGSPSSSTDKNPGTILYNEPGDYTIRLEASNRDGSVASKEIQVTMDAAIIVGFDAIVEKDNFPPVAVNIVNSTEGASTYYWTFEGGEPSFSIEKDPGQVIFSYPGEHQIVLTVGNGKETYSATKTIIVSADLKAEFDIEVAFEDDDFQVPVTMRLINTSSSATDYEWTFTGAVPAMSTEENPTITLNNPGTYTLRLKADNGKQTQTVSKEITVFPDTNLRTYNDVRLGINVAHSSNNIGAFFSTTTRQVYKQEDMPLEDEGPIDIVFFGQNPDFIFNKFVSPDMANEYTFNSINNAAHTKFINLQESCECNASLSEMEFDAMQDDSLLQELEIEETEGGIQDFDNTIVPRIVLFETADGRKGAIKIKEFVQDGASSHIVADIKVQKQ